MAGPAHGYRNYRFPEIRAQGLGRRIHPTCASPISTLCVDAFLSQIPKFLMTHPQENKQALKSGA
jgi:hypothetical protein